MMFATGQVCVAFDNGITAEQAAKTIGDLGQSTLSCHKKSSGEFVSIALVPDGEEEAWATTYSALENVAMAYTNAVQDPDDQPFMPFDIYD